MHWSLFKCYSQTTPSSFFWVTLYQVVSKAAFVEVLCGWLCCYCFLLPYDCYFAKASRGKHPFSAFLLGSLTLDRYWFHTYQALQPATLVCLVIQSIFSPRSLTLQVKLWVWRFGGHSKIVVYTSDQQYAVAGYKIGFTRLLSWIDR